MTIGLMGFEFVSANKGCEALSYSFLKMMEDIFEDVDYIVISNVESLGDVPSIFNNNRLTIVRENMKDLTFNMFRNMRKCDIIFDITMGDSFADIYAGKKCMNTILEKWIAEKMCSRYVLLPQTYGPFNIKKNEKAAMKVISNAWKVFTRDEISKKYISKNSKRNDIISATDLAFALPFDKSMYSNFRGNKKVNLGINVSGLLWRGGFNSKNQFNLKFDYKEYIDRLIKYFAGKGLYNLYIIPHVIDLADTAHDDDYKISKQLSQKYNVALAPLFKNPIQAKSFIANMDCFIGARMHSTVAAFSSGVATIPFSYSRKFQGLYQQLDYNYIVDGVSMSLEKAFNTTIDYVEKMDDIRNTIQDKMKDINKYLMVFKKDLEIIIKEANKGK